MKEETSVRASEKEGERERDRMMERVRERGRERRSDAEEERTYEAWSYRMSSIRVAPLALDFLSIMLSAIVTDPRNLLASRDTSLCLLSHGASSFRLSGRFTTRRRRSLVDHTSRCSR